jgi:alpha-tubulin suppressor-like RCC1 family protein
MQGEEAPFVMVQAKKYSVALTECGEMYIWGLRPGFGAPKKLRTHGKSDLAVVDVRLGSDKCYGLTAEGTLYEWDVLKGKEMEG